MKHEKQQYTGVQSTNEIPGGTDLKIQGTFVVTGHNSFEASYLKVLPFIYYFLSPNVEPRHSKLRFSTKAHVAPHRLLTLY
jgi:hypothetical protein